jgi:predicted kinase
VRHVVLISGAPGAGKSTLARPLAERLELPLLSKDIIKETLFDAMGHLDDDVFASSRLLGEAAMKVLWGLAGCCPAVVLEANFRASSMYERDRVNELCIRPVEVYCRVPPELALQRYNERGARPDHHAVHVRRTISMDALLEFQQPFGLGPVIEVDTSGSVDVDRLADLVNDALHE